MRINDDVSMQCIIISKNNENNIKLIYLKPSTPYIRSHLLPMWATNQIITLQSTSIQLKYTCFVVVEKYPNIGSIYFSQSALFYVKIKLF